MGPCKVTEIVRLSPHSKHPAPPAKPSGAKR